MTSKDGAGPDDEDLDAMMGSMRSMWRDLPDEEPPSRGLDALMAAARSKAVEMQPAPEKESWFRRALAMLARPPVLAAATVVVLVGSTVMLTRRDGGDRAATPTTQTFDDGAPAKNAPAEKAKFNADRGVAKDDEFAHGQGSNAPAPNAQPTQRPTRPRPAIVRPPEPVTAAKPPPADPAPEPMVAAPDSNREGLIKESVKPTGIKQTGEEDAPTAADSITLEATGGRAPAPATGRPPQVSSEQLLKQAETAANRKDCSAVRATVDRIRKIDDKLYRSRVVTQPAIKRCL